MRGSEGGTGVRRAIPLVVPGQRPLGVVCLCDTRGDPFAGQRERERQFLGYLHQAARALQLVARRTQELALAGRVQSSLLPSVPELPGWQLAAALLPARQTSGDYYDLIPLRDGRLGLVVADVADKGMGAALYMALSRTLIRTFAAQHPADPARVVLETSQRMLLDTRAGLFVTAFYGVLDPVSGDLTYCNAGHPPPVLINSRDPMAQRTLGGTGMALGAMEGADWKQERVRLTPGDLLLLYTDGLVDARNRDNEFFGRVRVLELLRQHAGQPASEVQEALIDAMNAFTGAEPAFDDVTLVVVRREEAGRVPDPGRRVPVEYPTFRTRVI
jgi:serine phosphatase RsbU (regulator of sigma subunit)